MKALILAGGMATRLRPITHGLPKCLLPIENDRTIFDIQVDALRSCGITDIIVVTGYMAEVIESHAHTHHPDITFTFIFHTHYEKTRAAHGLWAAKDAVAEPVIYLNSDLLCEPSVIKSVVENPYETVTAIVQNEWDEEEVNVVLGDGNRIVEIGKLIEQARSQGEFIGATKIAPSFWKRMMDAIKRYDEEGEYQKFAVDSMQEAIHEGGELFALDLTGKLALEIDTIEDYTLAKEVWARTI